MSSDWENLPKHLLDLVLGSLGSPTDCLEFSNVCVQWNHVATKRSNKRQLAKLASKAPPLLLIANKKRGTWNVYDVMKGELHDRELTLPNKRFCGSSNGWLIAMDEKFVVSLINPLCMIKGRKKKENSIIRLPPLQPPCHYKFWSRRCDHFVFKAMISADPILNANECIVAVIYMEFGQSAFIRLGKDTKWTYVDKSWLAIKDIAQIEDNKLYVVDRWSKLRSFDTTTRPISDVKLLSHGIEHERGIYVKPYLVDSNQNEILMVQRYYRYEGDGQSRKRVTKKFRVFEFKFDECEWIEKSTLGQVSVFVGDNTSISVSASKFSGCRPNCVYFTHDEDHISDHFGPSGPHDLGVYNLANQSFSQLLTKDAKTLVKKATRPPIWVQRPFWL